MIEMKPLEKQETYYIIGVPLSSGFYLFVGDSTHVGTEVTSEYVRARTHRTLEEAKNVMFQYPKVPGAYVILEVTTRVSVKEVEPRSNT